MMRVDRILVNRGMSGRKSIQKLIKAQRVEWAVDENPDNDVIIKKGDQKVPENAQLVVDGYIIPPIPLLLVYHKPTDVLSAMKDSSRYCLGDALMEKSSMLFNAGLHPVGRLDADTSGLILFSSDGALTQRLLHPRHEAEKEYVATVTVDPKKTKTMNEDALREKLSRGVETTEGVHTAQLLSVSACDDDDDNDNSYDVRLVVQEGKHRMVRRMLANCGFPVAELRRERHGVVWLGDLEEGAFRDLNEEELEWAEGIVA